VSPAALGNTKIRMGHTLASYAKAAARENTPPIERQHVELAKKERFNPVTSHQPIVAIFVPRGESLSTRKLPVLPAKWVNTKTKTKHIQALAVKPAQKGDTH